MGRETKFLLALLGLLAGVFLGVVSVKLFVPRPPAGAGPDVHGDIAMAEAQALVEPPALSQPPGQADPAAASPPLAPDSSAATEPVAERSSRFGGSPPRDPFVAAASFETAESPAPPADEPAPPADEPAPLADQAPPTDLLPPPSFERSAPTLLEASAPATFARTTPASPSVDAALPSAPPVRLGETYVAQDGDSWWSLAERAYGDGRLYRALFAWNRMLDPRVSLAPGTRLEIPPPAKLGASWPGLLPRD